MSDWHSEIGWDQFVYRQISADSSVYLSGNLVPDIALVSSHCWQLLTICVKEIALKRDQFLCCRNQLLHISGSVAQCVDRPHHWPLKLPLALHKVCASVRVQWGPGQFVVGIFADQRHSLLDSCSICTLLTARALADQTLPNIWDFLAKHYQTSQIILTKHYICGTCDWQLVSAEAPLDITTLTDSCSIPSAHCCQMAVWPNTTQCVHKVRT